MLITKGECGVLPVAIEYQLCNTHAKREVFVNAAETRIRFLENDIPIANMKQSLASGECIVQTVRKSFNTCEREVQSMSAQIETTFANQDGNDPPCVSSLSRKSVVEFVEPCSVSVSNSHFIALLPKILLNS